MNYISNEFRAHFSLLRQYQSELSDPFTSWIVHPNIINPNGVIDTEFSSGIQHYLPPLADISFFICRPRIYSKVDTHGKVRKSAFSKLDRSSSTFDLSICEVRGMI